jgi:hypothetical protein
MWNLQVSCWFILHFAVSEFVVIYLFAFSWRCCSEHIFFLFLQLLITLHHFGVTLMTAMSILPSVYAYNNLQTVEEIFIKWVLENFTEKEF